MRNVSYLALRPARSNTGIVSSHFMFFRQTWDGLSNERDFSIRSNHRVDLDSALSCAAAAAACKSLKSAEYSLIRECCVCLLVRHSLSSLAFHRPADFSSTIFFFFIFNFIFKSVQWWRNIDYHVYMFASERRFVFFCCAARSLCSQLTITTWYDDSCCGGCNAWLLLTFSLYTTERGNFYASFYLLALLCCSLCCKLHSVVASCHSLWFFLFALLQGSR